MPSADRSDANARGLRELLRVSKDKGLIDDYEIYGETVRIQQAGPALELSEKEAACYLEMYLRGYADAEKSEE